MWIDSHAHLYDYTDKELQDLIDEAHLGLVSEIISTAVSIKTAHIVHHQTQIFKKIWGAVGISPFDISVLETTWLSELTPFFSNKKIIAVGEIGIDGSNPAYPPLDKQIPVFEKQLELAVKLNLPAIIHSRGVESEALALCRNSRLKKVVFHCFTGNQKSLQAILAEGYTISISGIVTFKNAAIRDLVKMIPLEQLLIETDSPYLAPVPFRGTKNRPAMVRFVGEAISDLHKKDHEIIADQLKKNFTALFQTE